MQSLGKILASVWICSSTKAKLQPLFVALKCEFSLLCHLYDGLYRPKVKAWSMGDGEVFKRQGLERKVMMFLVCDLKGDCETWVSLSLRACFWGKLLVSLQNPTMTPLAKVQSQKPPDPGWEPPGQWAGGWNLMILTNLLHENVSCSLHYEAFLLQRQNNSILFACMACGGTRVQECGCMHLHACMWKLRKTLSIFHYYRHVVLTQDLPLIWNSPFWPGWSPRKFLESTCLYFWMLRLQACTVMSVFLYKCWGFEVSLLYFQNKCSYLLNHLPIS